MGGGSQKGRKFDCEQLCLGAGRCYERTEYYRGL